jgi:uncharacterized protein (TIGR02453 family)
MTRFNGFPAELFEFLRALAENNNRDWFKDNKIDYDEFVAEPVIDFISAFATPLETISENFVADPRRNGGSMFRIYRDTRFSRDKRPYKTNVGCHFRHVAGKSAHAPGFYLHLQPGNVFVGAGIWKPDGPALAKIRNAIVEQPDQWAAAYSDKALWQRFGDIEGESLKRAPRGFDADHVHVEHLKQKSFFIHQSLDEALATSPELIDEVFAAYTDSVPLVRFLTRAVELPF